MSWSPAQLVTEPTELLHYGRDWTTQYSPAPSAIAFPESLDEVQSIVRWANANLVALVPSGGRTGLSGGAVATNGEVVVSMERMRSILEFDGDGRTLKVQAGVTTQQVQEAASQRGLYYPVDFASRGSSQIGGNIATNAGGIKVLRYGLTRDWVAGLKVVSGAGDLLEFNRGLVKNATGYDLRHLFIGSEGTLGIVAEATLRLSDPPRRQQVILMALPSPGEIMPVFGRARRRLDLSAFEFFTDRALAHVLSMGARRPFDSCAACYVLAEFDEDEVAALELFQELVGAGLIEDAVLAQSEGQARELWRLREGITESIAARRPYKNDISVRIDQVPGFLRRAQRLFVAQYRNFEVIWFGHVGDGNLHISILPPTDRSFEAFVAECERVTHKLGQLLQEFGGSVSAEHGIGLLKRPYLQYSRTPSEIELMKQLKRVFDPAGIMNPGKLFLP